MKPVRYVLILLIAASLGGCRTPGNGGGPAGASTVTGSTDTPDLLGMDSRWAEHRGYLDELSKIVQSQWYKILQESRGSPKRGTNVTVKFRLDSKGEVEILQVEDGGAGKQGVFSCTNAITYPMPYRKWTDQMIATLGDSQELTFSFYFQ